MKKNTKTFAQIFKAAALTAVLTISAAAPAFAADTLTIDPAQLFEVDGDDLFGTGEGTVTTDIKVSGAIDASSFGSIGVNADIEVVTDAAAGAQSAKGSIGLPGVTYDFHEYFDRDGIMLQVPFLPRIISFNYNNDLEGSLIGQMIGKEYTDAIGHIKDLFTSMKDTEAMEAFAEEIQNAVTSAMSSVELTPAPAKDCEVGGQLVACQGLQGKLTPEIVRNLFYNMLDVKLPNGQTYREYFDMLMKLDDSGSDMADFEYEFEYALQDMPEFTVAAYVTDSGVPVEIDLTAEGSTLAIKFRGPESAPYMDVAIEADGEEIASLKVEETASGYAIIARQEGEEIGRVNFNVNEAGLSAQVIVYGQIIATADFYNEDQSFNITMISEGTPVVISGKLYDGEDGHGVDLSVMGLNISIRQHEGGTVSKPEGDVLELTTMTEQEFMEIFQSISTLMSANYSNAA